MIGSRAYSPGVIAGEILFLEEQVQRLDLPFRSDFVPVRVAKNTTLYRYKNAPNPYTGKVYHPRDEIDKLDGNDIRDLWDIEFDVLVLDFQEALASRACESHVFMIEGDDDPDFTYGALCVAVATLRLDISDWLLEREFGNYYSLMHISLAQLTRED